MNAIKTTNADGETGTPEKSKTPRKIVPRKRKDASETPARSAKKSKTAKRGAEGGAQDDDEEGAAVKGEEVESD